MAVRASEGLATAGKPFDKGKLNGAAETTERHERPAAIAILECIMKLFCCYEMRLTKEKKEEASSLFCLCFFEGVDEMKIGYIRREIG